MLQSNEKKHSIFGWFHLYTLVGWTPILDVAPLKRYTQRKGEGGKELLCPREYASVDELRELIDF